MNKTAIAIIAVVVVLGAWYYLAGNNSGGTVVQPPATTETAGASVNIQNFSFGPATLAVKTGTTVAWTNNDTVPHTVTSDSPDVFDSKTLAPGQSFSFTFSQPGSVSYHCAIHPMMKGTVSVEN